MNPLNLTCWLLLNFIWLYFAPTPSTKVKLLLTFLCNTILGVLGAVSNHTINVCVSISDDWDSKFSILQIDTGCPPRPYFPSYLFHLFSFPIILLKFGLIVQYMLNRWNRLNKIVYDFIPPIEKIHCSRPMMQPHRTHYLSSYSHGLNLIVIHPLNIIL